MNKFETIRYKIYYCFLKKSRIWTYFREEFLNNLLFELERFDIDKESIIKKYKDELIKIRKINKNL